MVQLYYKPDLGKSMQNDIPQNQVQVVLIIDEIG